MKKLMFVAALAAVGSAFALESANVVGYMNNDTIRTYHVMVAPGFSMVSEDGTFGLADLKAGGYDPSSPRETPNGTQWTGGCTAGSFELKILKRDGTTDRSYFYIDCKAGTEGRNYKEYPAGWYTRSGIDYTKISDELLASETFPQGQAFWLRATLAGLTLQSAGAVPVKDVEFGTIQNYHVAAGNGMPVDYTLGCLCVTGYVASTSRETPNGTQWTGGCIAGSFELKFLKRDGITDASYFYIDCKAGTEGRNYVEYPAGWYTRSGTTYTAMTKQEMEAVKVPAGQGFWIRRTGTTNLKLLVPAPEL